MKRAMALMLGCLVWAHTASAQAKEQPFVQEIAPDVFAHQGAVALMDGDNAGDIANMGFVIGSDGVVVIDTGGSVKLGEKLLAAVREKTTKPIRYIVTTHVHPDHWFGNTAFAATGGVFVGHKNLARALAMRGPFYLQSYKAALGNAIHDVKIIMPTLAVEDEAALDIGDRQLQVKAWKTAHTDNDVTVYDPASRIIFTGDLMFLRHTPVVDGSLLGFLAVEEKLNAIPALRAVPGHGDIAVAWPEALQAQRAYLETLARDLRQFVKQGAPVDVAARKAAQSQADKWALFPDYNPRNATAGFTELEWE